MLALLFAASARASAQEPTVTVEPGDTCVSIARRVYGDEDGVDALHDANPELGPTPHTLVPGTVLRVPPLRPLAEISSVVRRVERRAPDDAEFADAHEGDGLSRGSLVRTHEASSAELTFRDRARVTVREDTLVVVYGGARRVEERSVARAELERGALRSRLGELSGGAPLEVETPTSEATLSEGGVVRVEADGTSQIANHGDSAATVRAGCARGVLPADTGVVVRRGERAPRPRRLLPPPRWRADHRGFVVGLVERGGTLRGGFSPVRGAARYRVEVSRRADGGDVIAVLELPADATQLEIDGVPAGTAYVSMASIDADGLEGRRSPWRAFSVRLARLVQPGGALPDTSGPVVRVLPGTWLVSPRGLGCVSEIGSDSASALDTSILTLRAPGLHTLRCSDADGNVTNALEVEVAAPDVVVSGTLVRDRSARVEIALSGSPLPPVAVVALRAPEGFRVERVRGAEGHMHVEVDAPVGAPERVEVTLELVAGSERFELARTTLEVVDPPPLATPAAEPPEPPAPPPREARVVSGVLGDLAWPSALALRDERRGGVRGWAYAALVASPVGEPQLRVGGGAFAALPGTPLRLAVASQGDVLGGPRPVERRGGGDVLASLGALLVDDAVLSLAIDASALLATRAEPEGLGRVRLMPSAELGLRLGDWVGLRTRQGAIVDARERGARLWAFALGADLSIGRAGPSSGALGLAVELDGSVGEFDDARGAALSVGAGVELRYGIFDVGAAARFALTDEARALLGEWSVMATVRLATE